MKAINIFIAIAGLVSFAACAPNRIANSTDVADSGAPPERPTCDARETDCIDAGDASSGGEVPIDDAGAAQADAGAEQPDAGGAIAPEPWLMFHKDETHSGLQTGRGTFAATGPKVRWTYRVTDAPEEADYWNYRWYSSFPLGDLDGDGTLEVVVTSPDMARGSTPRMIALKDAPGETPAVRELWTYQVPLASAPVDAGSPGAHGHDAGHHGGGGGSQDVWGAGVDQYSSALVDADGDGLLDVVFTTKDGAIRALKGTTGALIWEWKTAYFIEAGPMIADLNGDGTKQIVLATGCRLDTMASVDPTECPSSLKVFEARKTGAGLENPPIWNVPFNFKIDSSEPFIGDLDPNDGENRKAIVLGGWGANLSVIWRTAAGEIVRRDFNVRALDTSVRANAPSVVRSSPLLANFGGGPSAVFGWMPDHNIGTDARISAVDLAVDMRAEQVTFTPRWTIRRDDWKSSPALLPVPGRASPLVVVGYGIGTTSGTGNYGLCAPAAGGIVAIDADGNIAWEDAFQNEGNVRSSPAVADIDGDGVPDVLLTVGCYGKLIAYDGATGARKWGFQLGPRTIGSPSVGDLDGNGTLEVVMPSFDGQVWALGGER